MRQSELRNNLTYLSGVVGLIAFIGSASLFITSTAQTYWTRYVSADLQIRNFNSLREMSAFNNTSENILIQGVKLDYPGNIEVSLIVDEVVKAGEIKRISFVDLLGPQLQPRIKAMIAPKVFGELVNTDNLSKEDIAKIISDLDQNDYVKNTVALTTLEGTDDTFFQDKPRHIRAACINANDPVGKLAENGQTGIQIRFQVIRGRSFSINVPCVAYVYEKDNGS
ncbi:MAG: hypothetical protein ABJQ71_18870 [Roseibium sp.]